MAIPTNTIAFPEVFSQTICKCHFLHKQLSKDTTCTSLYWTLYSSISYKPFMLQTILLFPFIDKLAVFDSINKVTQVADCIMNMLMDKTLV